MEGGPRTDPAIITETEKHSRQMILFSARMNGVIIEAERQNDRGDVGFP
jgi:hypothetical protein